MNLAYIRNTPRCTKDSTSFCENRGLWLLLNAAKRSQKHLKSKKRHIVARCAVGMSKPNIHKASPSSRETNKRFRIFIHLFPTFFHNKTQ